MILVRTVRGDDAKIGPERVMVQAAVIQALGRYGPRRFPGPDPRAGAVLLRAPAMKVLAAPNGSDKLRGSTGPPLPRG